MAGEIKKRILSYCEVNGITVPAGFGRHSPSRYVIVRVDSTPPKLVAMTWAKVSDLIYYLDNFLKSETGDDVRRYARIFDFKEGEELELRGGKQLQSKAKI